MAHILLIDDDEQFRYTAHQMLALDKHRVTECNDGKSGLEQLQRGQFDLVITDICMPEMDGLEFLRALKGTTNLPPIIVISGGGQRVLQRDFALQSARMAGASFILEKPLRLDALRSTLAQALGR